MNQAIAVLVVLAAIGGLIWYLYQKNQTPTRQQLKDWRETIEAGGVLTEEEYAAIDKLMRPGPKARYLKAIEKTRNSHSARAVTVEEIERDQRDGVPITSRQLEILQREGLLGTKAESKTPLPIPEDEGNER